MTNTTKKNRLFFFNLLSKTLEQWSDFELIKKAKLADLKILAALQVENPGVDITTIQSEVALPPSASLTTTLTIQGKPTTDDFDVRLNYVSSPINSGDTLPKPHGEDFFARSRDAISDPINALIEKDPAAGGVNKDGLVVLHNGLLVPLVGSESYYGEFSHLLVVNRGVHEPLEEFLFQEVVNSMSGTPVMIELGAYWSHYSMWMKSKLPNAQVTMVEPEGENIAAGRSNFRRNGLTGEFIQAFVGSGYFEIDEYMHERGIERIDLLHCDIQGFEVEMIEGAFSAFHNGLIDRVFISTHSDDLHETCIEKLQNFGYHIIASSDFQETTSWDGIIFATRNDELSPFMQFTPANREEIYRFSCSEEIAYQNMVLAARR